MQNTKNFDDYQLNPPIAQTWTHKCYKGDQRIVWQQGKYLGYGADTDYRHMELRFNSTLAVGE